MQILYISVDLVEVKGEDTVTMNMNSRNHAARSKTAHIATTHATQLKAAHSAATHAAKMNASADDKHKLEEPTALMKVAQFAQIRVDKLKDAQVAHAKQYPPHDQGKNVKIPQHTGSVEAAKSNVDAIKRGNVSKLHVDTHTVPIQTNTIVETIPTNIAPGNSTAHIAKLIAARTLHEQGQCWQRTDKDTSTVPVVRLVDSSADVNLIMSLMTGLSDTRHANDVIVPMTHLSQNNSASIMYVAASIFIPNIVNAVVPLAAVRIQKACVRMIRAWDRYTYRHIGGAMKFKYDQLFVHAYSREEDNDLPTARFADLGKMWNMANDEASERASTVCNLTSQTHHDTYLRCFNSQMRENAENAIIARMTHGLGHSIQPVDYLCAPLQSWFLSPDNHEELCRKSMQLAADPSPYVLPDFAAIEDRIQDLERVVSNGLLPNSGVEIEYINSMEEQQMTFKMLEMLCHIAVDRKIMLHEHVATTNTIEVVTKENHVATPETAVSDSPTNATTAHDSVGDREDNTTNFAEEKATKSRTPQNVSKFNRDDQAHEKAQSFVVDQQFVQYLRLALKQPIQQGWSLPSFQLTSFVFAMKQTKDPNVLAYLQSHVDEQLRKKKSLYVTYVQQKNNLKTTSWLDQFYFYARILFSSSMKSTANMLFFMKPSPASDLFDAYYEIYLQEIGESTVQIPQQSLVLHQNSAPNAEDLIQFDPTTIFWPCVSKTIHMLHLQHSVCELNVLRSGQIVGQQDKQTRDSAICRWPIRQTKTKRNTTAIPYEYTETQNPLLTKTDLTSQFLFDNEAYQQELLDEWIAEFHENQKDVFQKYMLNFIEINNPTRNTSSSLLVVVQNEADDLMPFIVMMFSMCCLLFYIPNVLFADNTEETRRIDAPAHVLAQTHVGNHANAATAEVQVQKTPPQTHIAKVQPLPSLNDDWPDMQYKVFSNETDFNRSIYNLIAIMQGWGNIGEVYIALSGNICDLGDVMKTLRKKNNLPNLTAIVEAPMGFLTTFIVSTYNSAPDDDKTVSIECCAVLAILLENKISISEDDTALMSRDKLEVLVFEAAKEYILTNNTDTIVKACVDILDGPPSDTDGFPCPLHPLRYTQPLHTFSKLRQTLIITTMQEIFRELLPISN